MSYSLHYLKSLITLGKLVHFSNRCFCFALTSCCLFLSVFLPAQSPFVTTWKTDNPGGSESNQIQIPGTGINYKISWEEVGNPGNNGSTIGNDATLITFPSEGTYSVSITPGDGTFSGISFGQLGEFWKILSIDQWGDIEWSGLQLAFTGCSNLQCNAVDIPDLSQVTSFENMFFGCEILNGPFNIGDWDIGNVTNLKGMFGLTSSFNQDIGNWNTENVTNMESMFVNAKAFNQDIGNWNTENVTNMMWMFSGADDFNQEIGGWNTQKVATMDRMFYRAISFNQDIGNWDIGNVTNMEGMFSEAKKFNKNIGNWNTNNVTNMAYMFREAYDFNQDIGNWNTENVTNMNRIFHFAGAFNQDIGRWNTQNVDDMSGMFCSAISFNQDISNWNTENVRNMSVMFKNAIAFNKELNNWNTKNVEDMTAMFEGASSFNQNIGNWNTENVTTLSFMFRFNSSYNQDIGNWNTQKVERMVFMFSEASSFNQDIGSWNTENVRNISDMFSFASSFNQDIGKWNISNVTNMRSVFQNATSFNQNLGNWELNTNVNMSGILDRSGMDCENFSSTLIGWSANPDTPTNRTLGADNLEYGNDAIEARNHLVTTKGWNIQNDRSIDEDCLTTTSVHRPEGASAITIWPNPVSDRIYVDVPQDRILTVYDLAGRTHLKVPISAGESQVPVGHLAPGMYLFHFGDGAWHKVVVQ